MADRIRRYAEIAAVAMDDILRRWPIKCIWLVSVYAITTLLASLVRHRLLTRTQVRARAARSPCLAGIRALPEQLPKPVQDCAPGLTSRPPSRLQCLVAPLQHGELLFDLAPLGSSSTGAAGTCLPE